MPGEDNLESTDKDDDMVVNTLEDEVDVASELSKLDGLLEQVTKQEPALERTQAATVEPQKTREEYTQHAMEVAKKYGLDINKNKTLGAILFSTAMQYGGEGAAGILDGAFKGKNASSMTEAEQINAIMDTKLQQLPRRFTVEKNGQAKAEQIWKEQRNRINKERNDALAAIGSQTSSQPIANVTPKSTVNNNSIPIPITINTSSKTDNAIDSGSKSSLPVTQASYRPSTMSDTVSNITRTSDSIKTETKSPIDIDMSTTNNILARQLDIQQQTLGVITNIYEKMVNNNAGTPSATQAKVSEEFPTSSININKRTYRS
jgi:hypothetical protein